MLMHITVINLFDHNVAMACARNYSILFPIRLVSEFCDVTLGAILEKFDAGNNVEISSKIAFLDDLRSLRCK